MIVRIMGEVRKLADDKVDTWNQVDAKLEAAVSAGDQGGFESSFATCSTWSGARARSCPTTTCTTSTSCRRATARWRMKELISGDGLIAGLLPNTGTMSPRTRFVRGSLVSGRSRNRGDAPEFSRQTFAAKSVGYRSLIVLSGEPLWGGCREL